MMVSIHQPNFLPWLGYFYKIYKSDCFVFLDDIQFVRRGYTNRVRIKNHNGEEHWLTVPVKKKNKYHQKILEVELEDHFKWKKKILGTLQSFYGKAPFFKQYFTQIEEILGASYHQLLDLNISLIQWMMEVFNIQKVIYKSSQLPDIQGESSDRLVSICHAVGANQYLSGFGGEKYQERKIFQEGGIELIIYDFKHPEYPQMWGRFIPGLSSIDLIFNCGPKCRDIIKTI